MLNLNYKKIGLIIGFVIIIFIIGYALYAVFFKSEELVLPEAEQAQTETKGLPSAGTKTGREIIGDAEGRLPAEEKTAELPETEIDPTAKGRATKTSVLSQSPSLSPSLAANGSDIVYYNQKDGKFYRLDSRGRAALLGDKKFFNVQKITWAPNKNKAILEYPDGSNILYNFDTDKQVTLPKHWEDFDFSLTGSQIVAKSIGLNPENRWLIISNDDGSQARLIEPLGENADKVHPSWSPNNLSIALFEKSVDFDRQKIYFIGKNKENFKTALVEGRGFQHKWTPNGEKIIYSVFSNNTNLKPNLWIVHAKGESIGASRRQLSLRTWADKCNLAGNDSLYCAVPKTLPEGAGLFPELAYQTADDIYKVDLKTGAKSLIAIPDEDYNITNIIVSKNEGNLYFTDRSTGRIHKVKLK